jgi:hypothetical protein
MKKIIFSILIVILWALPLSAEIYNSPFGFSIDIPSHWLIMSKQEIMDNSDLFNFEAEEFKDVNQDLLNNIKNMVASGQAEVYLNKETSNVFFNDNINVVKTIEDLPQTPSELSQYCTQLSDMLAEQLGKRALVYECNFKKIAGTNALYIVVDGVVEGTKSIQVQIPKSPNVTIVITATGKNETYEIISKEFDEIMDSLIFNDLTITNSSTVSGTNEKYSAGLKRSELLETERQVTSPTLQEAKKTREIKYDDGSKYIGDIVNGKRHGQGAYIWPDGRKYIGAFENNRATGGWLFKTIDHKVWIYQDVEGKWIMKDG